MSLSFSEKIYAYLWQGDRSPVYDRPCQLLFDNGGARDLGFSSAICIGAHGFFLGLIPVAGVIISLIPLCLIAYSIGGLIKVVYVVAAIAIIHAVEAYVLNPKFMSAKTDLPVFYTFIVLIFSQHFFGVWGLIIGIPVFVFLLDVLEVTDRKKRSEAQNERSKTVES